MERGQEETVQFLAVGGIGELFGVFGWTDCGHGDLAGYLGKMGLVSYRFIPNMNP